MEARLVAEHLSMKLDGITVTKKITVKPKGSPLEGKGLAILVKYDFTGCTLEQVLEKATKQLVVDTANLTLRVGADGGAARISNYHRATKDGNPWLRSVLEMLTKKRESSLTPAEKVAVGLAAMSADEKKAFLLAQLAAIGESEADNEADDAEADEDEPEDE